MGDKESNKKIARDAVNVEMAWAYYDLTNDNTIKQLLYECCKRGNIYKTYIVNAVAYAISANTTDTGYVPSYMGGSNKIPQYVSKV